jgi:hypothetical protein
MALLLEYLYTMDYEDTSESKLLTNVDVYVAADFYDIPVLKELAGKKLEVALVALWDSPQFLKAIETVYAKTPSTDCILRRTIMKVVMEHRERLLNPDNNESPSLPELMDEIPELGKDVLTSLMSTLRMCEIKWMGYRKLQCQMCRHIWADARVQIPDGTHCPQCKLALHSWDKHEVY